MSDLIAGALRSSVHAAVGRVVYLSPHFDDVPLSCGGSAALLQPGEGTCVTIFAAPAPPDAELNAYARRLHARWGAEERIAANEKRRAEERCAMRILGIDLLLLEDYGDAIYRGDRYTSHDHIFGDIHPDEREGMAEQLASNLRRLLQENGFRRDITLYAPLGAGHHVDHQLTHEAARLLERDGWDALYYEDYPYAEKPEAVAARLRELGFDPAAAGEGNKAYRGYQEIDATVERKVEAIACYESQITSLFADTDDMRHRVPAYAAQVRRRQREEHVAELQTRGMNRHQIEEWLAREDHQRMKRGQGEWRYAERFWRLIEK